MNVVLPELGEGIDDAIIACWHKNVGDQIESDDDILEVVTDKATFNVLAGVSGKIKEIHIKEGQKVNVGQMLAVIESSEETQKV